MQKFQTSLDKFLDTCFHLPTLLIIAMITFALVWQMYEFGLNLGNGFVRLSSNQGSITLHWHEGCCDLDW